MATVAAALPSGVPASAPPHALALPGPPGQPDIVYVPDHQKWEARAKRRLPLGGLPITVPEGFPTELKGKLAWDGATVLDNYDWPFILDKAQLAELDDALKHFNSLNLSLGHINQETFPLPNLHSKFRQLSDELHNGHGFFVIRGLDVDGHSCKENIIIYGGITAHITSVRGRQDHQFQGKPADVVMSHIKDLTFASGKVIGSPAYSADRQVFHTDDGDIVSLFALESSVEGGASKITSTWKVYNELACTRPDLIHTLAGNWDVENFGNAGPQRYTTRPLLFHYPATDKTPDRIALSYARRYFVGYGALRRSHDIPPITEAQAEALDALHFLGERFCVTTDFQKGDIQYINNLGVFHAREGFKDTPEQQRHLIRMWLRDEENAWQTPAPLQYRWDQLYKGVKPENEVFPLEPYVRSESKPR
ncbi:hypothetical protein FDECE_8326 [Fusarium decemcellulare]|nr:hypothetical protein FDECE_8326 [Fusarium decemcellulare]